MTVRMRGEDSEGQGRAFTCGKILATLLLFLLFAPSTAQEKPLRVIMENRQTPVAPLASIRSRGLLYASAKDLAPIFSMSVQENLKLRSLALIDTSRRIALFADNPFILLSGKAGKKALTFQLPSSVLYKEKSWFIPLAAATPLFEKLFGIASTYDATTNTLHIGKNTVPKPLFDITTVHLETKLNGMLIRVLATGPLSKHEQYFKGDGWLYITIPNTRADVATINKVKPSGAVKQIIAIQSESSVQLTFKLDQKILSVDGTKDDQSNDILFSLRDAGEASASSEERKKLAALEEQRKRYDLDVIVLDAGHGGKDPGTIGLGGTKEKDVALSIVLKLGKLIKKGLKDVKVVYTRDDDRFVELDRRGQIANNANGKLFISIHCNSMPRKPWPSRGFAVYLLRPGRTDEAIDIAERENSVIELEEGYERRYKKLTDENFILVTMAQSAHMRASEVFAEIALNEMNDHLNIPNKGVKQAGFLVLVGSAMPNVLIETAYLSNREDEKFLKSQSGQTKFAEAIFSAIKKYKEEYEKLLQEGKDLGDQ